MIDRALALLAAVMTPVALRLLPLPRVMRLLDRGPRIPAARAHPVVLADRVSRWLSHGVLYWRSTCLTRSAVLYAVLRQHGYRPSLHLGVAKGASDIEAHAWVSLDGTPLADAAANVQRYQHLYVHGG
jgi:hypothetical protein